MNFLFLASFGEIMAYIGYILLAILILLIMITIHELGHYIAGKVFGFGAVFGCKQERNGL